MNELDVAIRTALDVDAERAPVARTHWMGPLVMSGPTPSRPRRWMIATAAALIVLVGGISVIGSRHGRRTALQTSEAPSPAKPLLFPPNAQPTGGAVVASPGRFAALVSAPSRNLYTIELTENFYGAFPAGTPTRTVAGQTIGVLSANMYGRLEPCSMTTVSGPAGAHTWNPEVRALLAAQRFSRGVVTVSLPLGWSIVVPSSAEVTGYEYAVARGAGERATSIWAAPATHAGAIFGLYGPPSTANRVAFDGHRGWFSVYRTRNGATDNHLTWEAAGNAYDVTARGASQGELVHFARNLTAAPIAALERNDRLHHVASPPNSTATTTPTSPGECLRRSLNIT